MRRALIAIVIAFSLCYNISAVHADIGGNPIGPGPCDYPSVGITGFFNPVLGRGELAYCRFPREGSGSYYVQALGDYTIGGGAASSGGTASAVLGIGGGGSKTGYYCLSGNINNFLDFLNPTLTQEAGDPNPPGAWKNEIKIYGTCKPINEMPKDIADGINSEGLSNRDNRRDIPVAEPSPANDNGPPPNPTPNSPIQINPDQTHNKD